MQNQWVFSDDSIDRHGPAQSPGAGRLLVLVSNEAGALEGAIRGSGQRGGLTIVVSDDPVSVGVGVTGFDVIAIDISGGAGSALVWGLEFRDQDATADIVFFCEDAGSPELAAVRALGMTPIASGSGARDWIITAAPALIRAARARRDLRIAEANVPRFNANPEDTSPGIPLPLPVAEQRFRETYLRGLVASAGNRARAAQQAGIPYRTLCKAIQTFEIPVPGE